MTKQFCDAPHLPLFGKLQELPFCLSLIRLQGKFDNKLQTVCFLPLCSISGCSSANNRSLQSDWLALQVEFLFFGFSFLFKHYPPANPVLFDKRVQTKLGMAHHCVSHYEFDKAIWVLMSIKSLAVVWPRSIEYPEFHSRSMKDKAVKE